MTHVLLYWNHICVLHKQEKAFLERLADRLRSDAIDLEVRYFGLGYPQHMSEYLAREDAVAPDLIVSADLEVFEDCRISAKLRANQYPVSDWISLRQSPALDAVWRGAYLLPFQAIPLVYFSRDEGCGRIPLHQQEGLAIGGINNSAGKTIAKTVWNHHGEERARGFLSRCRVADMPIGAFQSVRTGASQTALVPSLYALRADETETFLRKPKEGALLIPSYFAVQRSIPEALARRLAAEILCPELCRFYANQGDLIVYPEHEQPASRQEGETYMTPSADWLDSLDPKRFYVLYCAALPTAKDPVKN